MSTCMYVLCMYECMYVCMGQKFMYGMGTDISLTQGFHMQLPLSMECCFCQNKYIVTIAHSSKYI